MATSVLLAGAQGQTAPPASAPAATKAPAVATEVAKLDKWVTAAGGRLGASVVDLANGKAIAESSPQAPLNPASTMKVITAAAALAELGPGFRFTTALFGTIEGDIAKDLVLRGHGDPSLREADLWRLAQSLLNRGVRRVRGGVRVDQSRFDAKFVPPAFGQQPNEWAAFRAPVSAVALERNAVTLNVLAAKPGEPARVWFEPRGFVDIVGRVTTAARGKGQDVRLQLQPRGGRLTAHLSGHVAAGLPRLRFRRRVDDPRLGPGHVLAQLLRDGGAEVEGPVGLGGEKATHRLTYVESEPLAVLLRRLGKRSDNYYAETIFKALGAAEGSGTSAQGARVVEAWLASIGATDPGTKIINGSGLFDANRLSAGSLTSVLAHSYRSPVLGPELLAQLAVGGVDGTLKSRFKAHARRRVVRAKTGTLNRVVALAGYVLGPDGRAPVAFAFIVEGLPGKHWQARRHIDACVDAIVRHLHG